MTIRSFRSVDRKLELILDQCSEFDRFTMRFLRKLSDSTLTLSELEALEKKWQIEAAKRRRTIRDAWIRAFWLEWDRRSDAAQRWFRRGVELNASERSLDLLFQAVGERAALLRAIHTIRQIAEDNHPQNSKRPGRRVKPSS